MNVSFGESKLQYDFYVKHLLSVMARSRALNYRWRT